MKIIEYMRLKGIEPCPGFRPTSKKPWSRRKSGKSKSGHTLGTSRGEEYYLMLDEMVRECRQQSTSE